MTKPNYTHFTLILDASGSMYPRENDVKGSLKTLIETHQAVEGTCDLRIIMFGSRSQVIYNGDIKFANANSIAASYSARMGGTALCDTVNNHRKRKQVSLNERK